MRDFGASSGLELGAFAGEPRAGVLGAGVPGVGVPHVVQAESVASLCGGVSSEGCRVLRGVANVNLARSRFHPSIWSSASSIFLVSWSRLYLFLFLTLLHSFFRSSGDSKLSAAAVAAWRWLGAFARLRLSASCCFEDRAAAKPRRHPDAETNSGAKHGRIVPDMGDAADIPTT